MVLKHGHLLNVMVAPREGCVSRNANTFIITKFIFVAPREGCVSRNIIHPPAGAAIVVAPREGCVSRNIVIPLFLNFHALLHPVRGV